MIHITDSQGNAKFNYGRDGAFWRIYPKDTISIGVRCRVEVAWRIFHKPSIKRFGFSSSCFDLNRVQEFWQHIQDKLGKRAMPIFVATDIKMLWVIEVPEFWRENSTRRSLFALLLRCSVSHYNNSFEWALKAYPLAREVIPAINYFLDGNVNVTYKQLSRRDEEGYGGFVAQFQKLPLKKIAEWLIK
jgi:hypothetical protein